jgi:hypothetical protein
MSYILWNMDIIGAEILCIYPMQYRITIGIIGFFVMGQTVRYGDYQVYFLTKLPFPLYHKPGIKIGVITVIEAEAFPKFAHQIRGKTEEGPKDSGGEFQCPKPGLQP